MSYPSNNYGLKEYQERNGKYYVLRNARSIVGTLLAHKRIFGTNDIVPKWYRTMTCILHYYIWTEKIDTYCNILCSQSVMIFRRSKMTKNTKYLAVIKHLPIDP